MSYTWAYDLGARFQHEVRHAIASLRADDPEEWARLCTFAFPDDDPATVDTEKAFAQAFEIDSCDTLSTPVNVWLSTCGYATLPIDDCTDEELGLV